MTVKPIVLTALAIVIATACKKQVTFAEMRAEAEKKIMGKWMVDHITDEVFHAWPQSLLSTTDYTGTPADFYSFQLYGKLNISSAVTGSLETNHYVVNPNQVWIHTYCWHIEELTANSMQLMKDSGVAAEMKRYITRMYLKR